MELKKVTVKSFKELLKTNFFAKKTEIDIIENSNDTEDEILEEPMYSSL